MTGRFSNDEVARYKDLEPIPKKWRTRLQRNYVPYVVEKYTEWFGNQHVVPDIIQHVAEVMTSMYPSLRDEDSDPENPTFVSCCRFIHWHRWFYIGHQVSRSVWCSLLQCHNPPPLSLRCVWHTYWKHIVLTLYFHNTVFCLQFDKKPSQSLICNHRLSYTENSKIVHCGIKESLAGYNLLHTTIHSCVIAKQELIDVIGHQSVDLEVVCTFRCQTPKMSFVET